MLGDRLGRLQHPMQAPCRLLFASVFHTQHFSFAILEFRAVMAPADKSNGGEQLWNGPKITSR